MSPRKSPANKGQKLHPEPLTQDEVGRLLKACSKRAPTGIRNRALIVLLYRAQLRIKEALTLMPKDLDAKAGTVRVLNGKGSKSRVVGLDEQAFAVIDRWADKRKQLGLTGRQPFICTLQGEPVKSPYVRAMLPRIAKRAKIEKRVHAHGLRHTGAFELANEGFPLHVIQQQLGHSSLATTDRYIRHLTSKEVVEAMKARKWES